KRSSVRPKIAQSPAPLLILVSQWQVRSITWPKRHRSLPSDQSKCNRTIQQFYLSKVTVLLKINRVPAARHGCSMSATVSAGKGKAVRGTKQLWLCDQRQANQTVCVTSGPKAPAVKSRAQRPLLPHNRSQEKDPETSSVLILSNLFCYSAA